MHVAFMHILHGCMSLWKMVSKNYAVFSTSATHQSKIFDRSFKH